MIFDHAAVLLSAPDQRRLCRVGRGERHGVGVRWLRHGFESRSGLRRQLGTVDDQSRYGVEAPRALIEIHGTGVQPGPIEYEHLGVQPEVSITTSSPTDRC